MAEDINAVTIVGRLTRDAELKYTGTGAAVVKMSLASNRSRKDGDNWIQEAGFFDVSLWGRRGEALVQYLLKGSKIAVSGSLRYEAWEQDGQKRSRVLIHAENIQLLGESNSNGNNQGPQRNQQSNQSRPQNNNQGSRNENSDYNPHNDSRYKKNNNRNFEDDIPI